MPRKDFSKTSTPSPKSEKKKVKSSISHSNDKRRIKTPQQTQVPQRIETPQRIAKVIARCGVCSRRTAETYIAQGRVKLDGVLVKTPATLVTPGQKITLNDNPLPQKQKRRLWRYYKPTGLVTSHRDEKGRATVFDDLPDHLPHLISVGRLDLNSEGLLLLTNDGELSRHLELPQQKWVRHYRVRVRGYINEKALMDLEEEVTINGITYGKLHIIIEKKGLTNSWLQFFLQEGKNREIRKLLEHVHLQVNRLIRLSYGPFSLGGMRPHDLEEIAQTDIDAVLNGQSDSIESFLKKKNSTHLKASFSQQKALHKRSSKKHPRKSE